MSFKRRMKRKLIHGPRLVGWRWTSNRRRRYPVMEPPERTIGYLLAESNAAQQRMGIA